MGCLKSAPEVLLAALLVVLPAHAADETSSRWSFGSWIDVGTGYENESRVDPDLNRAAVPGGAFLNFTPSATLARPVGARSRFSVTTTASMEQFLGDDDRTFLGLSALGELTLRSGGPFYGRISLGGEFFDDSEIDTARRSGAAGRGAVGWGTTRRAVELALGARQREYHDLIVEDDGGNPGAYDETTSSIGVAAFGITGRSTLLRGEVSLLSTDARDPLFDSTSIYLRADARLAHGRRWTTQISALYQRRQFDERAAGEDSDDYMRLGLRVGRKLGKRQILSMQYSYALYGEPTGEEDDTHRIAVLLTSRFGRATAPAVEPLPSAATVREKDALIADGTVRFRIHAPGAATVSVAGDFNGWDRSRHSMREEGGGWWGISIRIDPGNHQYAYVIDGEWIEPPNPEVTVEDGFGGRNGLLVVPE
jgi:hypothetical protein